MLLQLCRNLVPVDLLVCPYRPTATKRSRLRKGLAIERFTQLSPMKLNLGWWLDFVMDSLAKGRRIRYLIRVDNFMKECFSEEVVPLDFRRTSHTYS